MTHFVIASQNAKDDLRHYYAIAPEHAPETAAQWLDRFEEALQPLSTNPTRCPLAPENDLVDRPVPVRLRKTVQTVPSTICHRRKSCSRSPHSTRHDGQSCRRRLVRVSRYKCTQLVDLIDRCVGTAILRNRIEWYPRRVRPPSRGARK